MRKSESNIGHVQILKRVAVGQGLELIVALGTPNDRPAGKGESAWWGERTTLGILLQRSTQTPTVYKIALSKGDSDCETRVERATSTDIVLSCTPEKGARAPNHKFVYKLDARALLKEFKYEPTPLQRIFVSGESAVLVGSNGRQLLAVKYNLSGKQAFQILKGAQALVWTEKVGQIVSSEIGPEMQGKTAVRLAPETFKPVRFGLSNRFTLAQESETQSNSSEKHLIVLDRIGKTNRAYPMPRSTYDEFARARPSGVQLGHRKQDTIIEEAIGPWQIADGTLWFGKTFYDGEGNTGVGGFGYFDVEKLKYRIYVPKEVAGYSVTAMRVEPDAVWLALATHGEYGSVRAEILRFDRVREKVERIEFHDIVSEIARVGTNLLFATDFGAAVLQDDHAVRRFFVDQTTDGQIRMSQAVLGHAMLEP